MANMKLLDWVMNHIEANQELWEQDFWFTLNVNGFSGDQLKQQILDDPYDPACGSAKCFAGWACTKEGWLPKFQITTWGINERVGTVYKDGVAEDCPTKARELLEIDSATSSRLFDGGNDLDTLRKMVEHIREHGNLHNFGEEECDDCSGSGEVESECYACGQETMEQCRNCEGSGQVSVYA